MSLADVMIDYVRSGKLVKLLAKARTLTESDVYGEIGRIAQEALATYVPAIAAMVELCKRVPSCEGELITLRTRVVREVFELLHLDAVLRWLLDILKRLPQWLLDLIQDVSDVWKVIDEWSRGKFSLSDLGILWNVVSRYAGAQLRAAANAAGRAILKAGDAVGTAIFWFADANIYANTYITREAPELVLAISKAPSEAVAGWMRDAGLGVVADALEAPTSVVNAVVGFVSKAAGWAEDKIEDLGPVGTIGDPETGKV